MKRQKTYTLLKAGVLILSLFFPILLPAQHYAWSARTGNTFYEEGNVVQTDAAGNVFSAGTFSMTVDFDPGPAVFEMTAYSEPFLLGTDVFLQKLDSDGNFLWAKQIGGNASVASVFPTDMRIHSNGNIYITGTFSGTIDVDPDSGVVSISKSFGLSLYLLKLNPDGEFEWVRQIEGDDRIFPQALALDQDENVIVTGEFTGKFDFDPGMGSDSLDSGGQADMFVWKLDKDGTYQWARSMVGVEPSVGLSAVADSDGSILLLGNYRDTTDFDPGPGQALFEEGGTAIQKLDPSGNLEWVKSIKGIGLSIQLDAFENMVISGFLQFASDLDPDPAVTNIFTPEAFNDAFVLKLRKNGEFLWASLMPGPSNERVLSSAIDSDGNIYSTGLFKRGIDLDPGPDTLFLEGPGGMNFFIQKLDSTGSLSWAIGLGGDMRDESQYLTLGPSNSVYIIGQFDGILDLDPGIDSAIVSPLGSSDVFLLKLSSTALASGQLNFPLFKLYPNPAKDVLSLELEYVSSRIELEIYSLEGKKVDSQAYTNRKDISLDVSWLPQGTYFIKIVSDRSSGIVKFKHY